MYLTPYKGKEGYITAWFNPNVTSKNAGKIKIAGVRTQDH